MTIASIPAHLTLESAAQSTRWSKFDLVALLKTAKLRRSAYRQTVNELSMLKDRELNDIGICRSDIRRLAREEAQKA